jgi:hypothetical protein
LGSRRSNDDEEGKDEEDMGFAKATQMVTSGVTIVPDKASQITGS